MTAGVIDKAILMALSGKRCLILTNGGMVKHAMKRISDYVEKSDSDQRGRGRLGELRGVKELGADVDRWLKLSLRPGSAIPGYCPLVYSPAQE